MMNKKVKYQNPYVIYPPDSHSGLPTKNRPVLLSDEFAKAAMQGMMVNFGPDDEFSIEDIAKISYEMAEQMLKARHAFTEKMKTRKKEER
jgi:hypothetical protein